MYKQEDDDGSLIQAELAWALTATFIILFVMMAIKPDVTVSSTLPSSQIMMADVEQGTSKNREEVVIFYRKDYFSVQGKRLDINAMSFDESRALAVMVSPDTSAKALNNIVSTLKGLTAPDKLIRAGTLPDNWIEHLATL